MPLLKAMLFPPGFQLFLLLFAVLVRLRYRWLSYFLVFVATASLWLLSTPAINQYLYRHLTAAYVANTPEAKPDGLDAIVVLGAGRRSAAGEYNGDTLNFSALERLRYGGYLANKWDLPVIVSGGTVIEGELLSEAELGARFLREELQVASAIEEGHSRNTWENAQYTREVLEQRGMTKVALVTHGYHMRRAAYSFTRANIDFIPFPTGYMGHSVNTHSWLRWTPGASSLFNSRQALHEYVGLLAYRMK